MSKPWEILEARVARRRCPKCRQHTLRLAPVSYPVIDAQCANLECLAGVQVKYCKRGPKPISPPQSAPAFDEWVDTFGISNLYVVSGNLDRTKVYSVAKAKVKRSIRERVSKKKGQTREQARKAGQTYLQERVSFTWS